MDKESFVDFNRPALVGNELVYITEAVSKLHISGDGYFTQRCQATLQEELGTRKALLTTSCTHALEMAAILLNIQPGDQVIVPSFTFVSTVNAFVLRGAQPVFIDIRQDTLNMDERQLQSLVNERTRAILTVHYAGVGCEMEDILKIAENHHIPVVEDNAHGLFGRYKGKLLGTFGCLATLSFHETKNISCGEGGALLINDAEYIERAEIIREKGTNRSRFFRGQVDKYTWVDIGSSYLLSDILAAFLYAQLEMRLEIQARRRVIWERYLQGLANWADQFNARLPIVPPHCEQPYHMFYLLLPSLDIRQSLISYLRSKGIQGVFHYQPLHMSEMGKRFGGRPGDCPVTEEVSDRLLRLPFHAHLNEADQMRVIETIKSYDK